MKYIIKAIMIALFTLNPLWAKVIPTGTVSILILKDGKPLFNNEILIDGAKNYRTDRDGWIESRLNIGAHTVEIYGKEEDGMNLGYIKKPFEIKREKDTQIIASFTSENILDGINIDIPSNGSADQNSSQKQKATGKGTISGIVMISTSGKPIAGARVFIKGTDIDARTDKNGRFSVTVPSGISLGISVVHSAYSAQTLNDIRVEKGQTLSKTFKLTPASMELEEYVVLAPKVQGSIASVMAEEKESSSIANILGSQQLAKRGDSSAAGALRRVTGLTLVGGKSIFVRGLGERYSNIEMNSMPLPSPDPTKRVVPLDIFPASVIGSLKVQKSASADIPSSFGGGYIDIRTKDKSDKDFFKVSAGISGNSETGSDTISYKGGDLDWLGFDDGSREVPASLYNGTGVHVGERIKSANTRFFTKEQLVAFTKAYAKREFNTFQESLPLGGKFSIEGAKSYEKGDHKIALFGNYGYSQKHTYNQETINRYDYAVNGAIKPQSKKPSTKEITKSTYAQGGIFNIGYHYKDFFKLKFTELYTLKSEKKTRYVDGILGSNDDHLHIYNLDWEERSLNAHQLSGSYEYNMFNHYNELSFGAEYAQAALNQPGNINYSYIEEDGKITLDVQQEQFLTKKLESNDDLIALYLKNKFYLDIWSEDDALDMGLTYSNKERVSKQSTYYMKMNNAFDDSVIAKSPDEIMEIDARTDASYDERVMSASSLFNPADFFDASIDKASLYAQTLLKPTEKFETVLGLKYVNITQTIYQYIPNRSNGHIIEKVPESLEVNDLFPNLSLKYKKDEGNHFDLALSRTFIIPDLREFTSGSYFHPYEVATVRGNPDLVNTDIYNVDFKYSHYFSGDENIKTGLFFKYLLNPIEDTAIPSSSLPEYSYDNSDNAILYGIEIEGRKKLDILKEGLENYYIAGNFSYTDSDVTLTKKQEKTFTTNHRQLQGLSQVVTNLTLGYDDKQRSVTLSYNKMGERIRKVGLKSSTQIEPDNVEIPASILDFVWIENINKKTKLSFKANNLLDPETVWEKGGLTTKRFKTGRAFSFSASYKF